MSRDRLNQICSVLTSVLAVFAGILAYVQTDAAQQDQTASRDARRYALQAFGLEVRGRAEANFAHAEAYKEHYELQQLSIHANATGEYIASEVYNTASNKLKEHSPIFKEYYNEDRGTVDSLRFEADLYVREVARLEQNFQAASNVKVAWKSKATAHVFHLTLLAVSLFLLGQATSLKGDFTRRFMFGAGLGLSVLTLMSALFVWAVRVPDLRDTGAIDFFANGVALDHQGLSDKATAEYDRAIEAAPKYLEAYMARGRGHLASERYAKAVKDFERSWKLRPHNPVLAANLADVYYRLGRFEESIQYAREAVLLAPEQVDHRAMLALATLAKGDFENGKLEYEDTMELAAKTVAHARRQGQQPPAYIWETLDQASYDLELLQTAAESGGEEIPPKDKIGNHEQVIEVSKELQSQIDGLAVALEYSGEPPKGTLTAEFGELTFGLPIYKDDQLDDEIEEFPDDLFPAGTRELVVQFPYGGMRDGQELVMRVFFEAEELPSWRLVEKWSYGGGDVKEDIWYKVLSPGYSETAAMKPGHYLVEFFLDGHPVQKGAFDIDDYGE